MSRAEKKRHAKKLGKGQRMYLSSPKKKWPLWLLAHRYLAGRKRQDHRGSERARLSGVLVETKDWQRRGKLASSKGGGKGALGCRAPLAWPQPY